MKARITKTASRTGKLAGSKTDLKLGQLFKSSRINAGLSLAEVADYLGVDAKTVEAYESGKINIPLKDIYAMANYLNLSPSEIQKLIIKSQQKD